MLILGVILVLLAIALIIFGVAGTAVQWLLYLGIAVAVVALVLIVVSRRSPRV